MIFTAWSWELDEPAFIDQTAQDVRQFMKFFPSVVRIDLLTIVRCPGDRMCNPNGIVPPMVGENYRADEEDCYVPPFIDDALAQVAAQFPGLVFVGPHFESPACASPVNGAHLYMWDKQIAAEIGAYYADPAHL